MQQFLNFIANVLTNPIAYFAIFALIGAFGRFAAWVKEQRVKRAIAQQRAQLRAEALRTGRPLNEGPAGGSVQASPADERQARLRAMQEQRAAQLRELQQRRLAELRAKRAAQASQGGSPVPAVGTSPASSSPPARRPGRPVRPPQNTPQTSQPTPPARRQPRPDTDRVRPASAAASTPIESIGAQGTRPISVSADRARSRAQIQAPPMAAASRSSARQTLFGSREELRRSIIAAEVLGPPLAMREDDERPV